ncbi:hypothetical protein EJB05_47530, partial [Eragrostis curvula]
ALPSPLFPLSWLQRPSPTVLPLGHGAFPPPSSLVCRPPLPPHLGIHRPGEAVTSTVEKVALFSDLGPSSCGDGGPDSSSVGDDDYPRAQPRSHAPQPRQRPRTLVPGVSATAPPARLPWVRRAWELGGDAASPADLSSLSDAPAVAELHRLSILVLVGLSSTPLPLQRPPSIRCFTLCAPCRRNKDNEEQDWASGCNLVAESLKKDREAGACWQSQTSVIRIMV